MNAHKCTECHVTHHHISELEDQLTDRQYSDVTSFLWGLLVGIIVCGLLVCGF